MSEKVNDKAKRYLIEGRVVVELHGARGCQILVQGSDLTRLPYVVSYKMERGRWECDCPAYTDECAHIVAAQFISPFRNVQVPSTPLNAKPNDDITDFLNKFMNRH